MTISDDNPAFRLLTGQLGGSGMLQLVAMCCAAEAVLVPCSLHSFILAGRGPLSPFSGQPHSLLVYLRILLIFALFVNLSPPPKVSTQILGHDLGHDAL